MKERLLKFLEHLRIGQTKFEAATGLSNGLINNIKGSINVDTLAKIKRKYPELSLDWLVMGEGDMLVSGDNNIQVRGDIAGNVVGGSGNTLNSSPELAEWYKLFDKRMDGKDKIIQQKDRIIAAKDREIASLQETIRTLSDVIKKKLS
ncbi:MAG: hypothetical protein MdMp024_0037 [Bacteroidales bacterium]